MSELIVERHDSLFGKVGIWAEGTSRVLKVNDVVQSVFDPLQPLTGRVWDYFLLAPAFHAAKSLPTWTTPFNPRLLRRYPAPARLLILGFGAGTIARLYHYIYGDISITGIEKSRTIMELTTAYFPPLPVSINVEVIDALEWLKNDPARYDIICIDTFHGDQFNQSLATREALNLIESHLTPGGLAVFNRINDDDTQPHVQAFLTSLAPVFRQVATRPVHGAFSSDNLLIFCR